MRKINDSTVLCPFTVKIHTAASKLSSYRFNSRYTYPQKNIYLVKKNPLTFFSNSIKNSHLRVKQLIHIIFLIR